MVRLWRVLALAGALAVAGAWQYAPGTSASEAATAVIAQDTLGKAIFLGKGTCSACHGVEGKGSMLAPDLTDGVWLNIDGTIEAIVKLVKEGVPQPKEHPAPMPPMGGAQLTDAEIQAVAVFIKTLSEKQ